MKDITSSPLTVGAYYAACKAFFTTVTESPLSHHDQYEILAKNAIEFNAFATHQDGEPYLEKLPETFAEFHEAMLLVAKNNTRYLASGLQQEVLKSAVGKAIEAAALVMGIPSPRRSLNK